MGFFRSYSWFGSQNMTHGIRGDWKKKSDKTKDNLFGTQDKTWGKTQFLPLNYKRDIEILITLL